MVYKTVMLNYFAYSCQCHEKDNIIIVNLQKKKFEIEKDGTGIKFKSLAFWLQTSVLSICSVCLCVCVCVCVCVYQGKYLLFGKIALKNLRKEIEKRKALDCETGWSTFSVC